MLIVSEYSSKFIYQPKSVFEMQTLKQRIFNIFASVIYVIYTV